MKKKALSLLLVLVMVFSMLPVAASADDAAKGTPENPYVIGDTVTNDGSAEPEGSKVENGEWQVKEVVQPSSVLKCEKVEHSHGDGKCDFGTKSVVCEKEHVFEDELTDGATCSHTDGTVCTYNAETQQWLKTVSGDECILEEHTHSNDECYETVSGYTVWELVEKETEKKEDNEGKTDTKDTPVPLSDDPVTYTVTFTVQYTGNNSTQKLSGATISVVASDGANFSTTTDNSGVATCTLPAGTYTATINYTKGEYTYTGEEVFEVIDQDVALTIYAIRLSNESQAEKRYEDVTFFDHVDIRVNGTFRIGTTTYNVKLKNVNVVVNNPNNPEYNINQTFTYDTSYEWRVNQKNTRVYKDAVITVTCDIYDSEDNLIKSGFTKTFQGKDDFVRAIQQCDGKQGLDFIIDGQEIAQAILYGVSYQWTVYGVDGEEDNPAPVCIPALPATTTGYESGATHTVNTTYYEGCQVTDTDNGVVYTFSGWTQYQVGSGEKQAVTDTKVTVTDNIVIYGVWTASKIEEDNYVWPNLIVRKVRDANGKALAGATFRLYAADGTTVINESTTGTDGELIFRELTADNSEGYDCTAIYYLEEVTAPDTYERNTTKYKVTVKYDHSGEQTLVDGAYVTDHYYVLTVEGESGENVLFNSTSNELTVPNTKSVGSLTIKKLFGNNSAYFPEKIDVTVKGPGDYSKTVTLSEDNEWTQTLTGLTFGEYTVTEEASVAGYPLHPDSVTTDTVTLSPKVEGDVDQADQTVVLRNTYTKEVVHPASFTITKVDENGNVIPTGAEFTLYSDEECTKVAVTAETDENGVATFSGFKEEATYYLKETEAPEGYQLSDDVWVIKIELQGGEPSVEFVELDEEKDEWQTIYNWVAQNDDFENGVLTVGNKPETTSVTVKKEWNDENNLAGFRPKSVQVQLYKTVNDELSPCGEPVTLNENGEWKYEWTNLPVVAAGQKVTYSVEEIPEGALKELYTSSITGSAENGFVITNTHTPERIDISGEKTWVGDEDIMLGSPRPESITVYLADDNNNVVAEQTVTPDKETGKWTYSFENVPKYANGELIQYKILEKKVPGYTYSPAGNGSDSIENSYDIINTYNSELISITVTKSWVDGDNQDGIRPDSVEVQLKGNGKPVGESVALNADNGWSYTFDVDKDYQGKEIKYTVEEVNVPRGYTPVVNTEDYGFSITNTHVPEVTSVTVQKVWNDENDLAGYRPESVQVQLYKTVNNQTVPYGEAVTLNEDVRWKHEWTNLPVKEAGEAITYSVSEVEVPDHYDAAISVRAGNVFVLTNTHDPAKTNITVTKTWDDGNDRDGLRPSSVKVTLYRNGTKVKTVTLSEKNDWTYVFTDMQVYADGEKANYTVTETKVDNYQPKVTYTENPNTGLAIELVNSYTPEQTSVTVTKKWTDSSNKAGDRSASVTIYLLANGEKTGDELVLNSANKWTGSFDNLPVKKDGKTIKYTISEKAVANYTAKITGSAAKGFVVTNTHTSIPVTGDESNLVLYAVLFAIGAAAAVSALILSKKKFGRRR